MQPLVVFSHGKDAAPNGRKISCLTPIAQNLGWRVISIDYTDVENPDLRVKRLETYDLGEKSLLVLVGSSMGGYVSVAASKALTPDGLFLMAPALNLAGYLQQTPQAYAKHTLVVSGWNDAVVPVDASITFARRTKAELHLFNSDHMLWDVLPQIGAMFATFLKKIAGDR